MSLFASILRSTAWLTGGKLAMMAIGLVQIKLITGYLGRELFGDYTTMFEFLAMFGFIADMGMLTVTLRELGRRVRPAAEVIGNVLGLRLILSVVAMGSALLVAQLMPSYTEAMRFGVAVVGLGMIFNFLAGSMSGILQSELRIGGFVIAQTVGRFLTFAIVAFAVYANLGWDFLISASLWGNLLLLAIMIPLTLRSTQLSLRFDVAYWRELFRTALPYGIALIFGTIYFKIDITLVHAIRGSGEAGLYGIAMKLLELGTVLGVFLMNSAFTAISGFLETKKFAEAERLVTRSLEFLLVVGCGAVGIALALAEGGILFVSGPDFLPAAEVLRVLFFTLPVFFFTTVIGFLLVAAGASTRLLLVNVVATAFNIGANLLVIPTLGAMGAAGTTVASEILILAGLFYFARTSLPFRIRVPLRSVAIALGAALLGGLVAFLLRDWFFLAVPAGGIVWLGVVFLGGGFRLAHLRSFTGRGKVAVAPVSEEL